MDTGMWILVAVVVVLIAAIAWVMTRSRRQRAHLKDRFGPEYERTVERAGSRKDAERDLLHREERREELDIRPLERVEREEYLARWEAMQGTFVDAPAVAVREADLLLQDVMRTRGYPVEDFEERAATVSVDHPRVVDHYRAAHRVAERQGAEDVSTEDLRQALLHYRQLFEELTSRSAGGASAEAPPRRDDRVDASDDDYEPRRSRA